MALANLEPSTRIEAILDGAEITPATRMEYFLQKAAAAEVPKAAAANTGKVLTSSLDGDNNPVIAWASALPDYSTASAGDVLMIVDGAPAWGTLAR